MATPAKLSMALLLVLSSAGADSAWATKTDNSVTLRVPGGLVVIQTDSGEGQVTILRNNGKSKGYRTVTHPRSSQVAPHSLLSGRLGPQLQQNWVQMNRHTWWTRVFPHLVVATPQEGSGAYEKPLRGTLARIGGMALKASAHLAVGLKQGARAVTRLIPNIRRTARAKGNSHR